MSRAHSSDKCSTCGHCRIDHTLWVGPCGFTSLVAPKYKECGCKRFAEKTQNPSPKLPKFEVNDAVMVNRSMPATHIGSGYIVTEVSRTGKEWRYQISSGA